MNFNDQSFTTCISQNREKEMDGLIRGLHHVTAMVADARQDYLFYTRVLGLRLIKETINFDDESVYHLYYGNELGLPSTVLTTFPYGGHGIRSGTTGSGQVCETAFSVPEASLGFWKKRLQSHGMPVEECRRFNQKFLLFNDPSGLKLSMLEDAMDRRKPVWVFSDIPAEYAITGIHHVTLALRNPVPALDFLNWFGYQKLAEEGNFTLLATPRNASGKKESSSVLRGADNSVPFDNISPFNGMAGDSLVVMSAGNMPDGVAGMGTVHHVAHRVTDIADSQKIKALLEQERGVFVTGIADRKYFQSIYFRIPGGVLFEVATEGPGFLVDEQKEHLGSELKLPSWQESRRQHILAGLESYR